MLNLYTTYFTLFGLTIHYYGIISAVGYLVGVVVTCCVAKKRGFTTDDIVTCACYIIPLCIIGARACYVLNYLENFDTFWEAIAIWDGGLVFYGGLIGGALGAIIYCLIHKKNILKLIDVAACGLVIGQGIGRWGNFVNQEAYGTLVTDPNLQWFPFAVYIERYGEWHLATFFYEFVNNMVIFCILMALINKVNFKNNGIVASLYLIMYGFCRYFVEGLRTDSVYIGTLRFSQVLSVIFIACGLTYIISCMIYNHIKKKKRTSFDIIMDVVKNDLD